MICKFCQENIRGTPCQFQSQANKCVNFRDNDWPDDHIMCENDCNEKCKKEKESTQTQ